MSKLSKNTHPHGANMPLAPSDSFGQRIWSSKADLSPYIIFLDRNMLQSDTQTINVVPQMRHPCAFMDCNMFRAPSGADVKV